MTNFRFTLQVTLTMHHGLNSGATSTFTQFQCLNDHCGNYLCTGDSLEVQSTVSSSKISSFESAAINE